MILELRKLSFLLILFLSTAIICRALEDVNVPEDNEFAEFEQFDSEDRFGDAADSRYVLVDEGEEDGLVEDEDGEFEHFQDPEEFEGFAEDVRNQNREQPKITITKVPIVVRARWEAYWAEGLLVLGLMIYAATFLIGRSKNYLIAQTFVQMHKPLLDDNFTLVGGGENNGWCKEAEHCFTMWCSGRTCCEGMLLTLKLIKRQDLVHLIIGLFKPSFDTLQVRVELGKEDSDAFVLCIAQKKTAARLAKEMTDLSVYCGEKRPGQKMGLPETFSVLSELAEASQTILDPKVCTVFAKYGHLIEYLHISDQFSGPKQPEENGGSVAKPAECQRVMLLSLIVPCNVGTVEESCEAVRPLLIFIFYLLEKLKRFRLSKEASVKSEKNRQKVEEAFLKSTHAQRQQMAAQKREDKRRQEKDRIMAEEDPEKQRRWEKKEQKRQLKKKTPKMKQLKVKAL